MRVAGKLPSRFIRSHCRSCRPAAARSRIPPVGKGRSEDRHEAVPEELVDHAVMPVDDGYQLPEQDIEEVDDLLGPAGRGKRVKLRHVEEVVADVRVSPSNSVFCANSLSTT